MPRDDGKPAGWRFYDVQFWQRGEFLKCHDCKKETAKTAPESARHSTFCEKREAGPIVRGPDLPKSGRLAREILTEEWGINPPVSVEREHPIDAIRSQIRAIEKQGKPEKSDVYREWVKQGTCVNCGGYPTDPHHEDTTIGTLKRGKGQKARDTLCVSLCRPCHDALTGIGGGYLLPCPDGGEHTHAESKAILHDAQEERLRRALEAFPQEWRIEILSKGIACVPEGVKRRALMGDVDDRLADALDASGEEPI